MVRQKALWTKGLERSEINLINIGRRTIICDIKLLQCGMVNHCGPERLGVNFPHHLIQIKVLTLLPFCFSLISSFM